MRKLVIYFTLFSLFISCKKNKLTEFDLNYSSDVTIPASSAIINLPFSVTTPEVTTNTQSTYDNQGTTSKLIDQVILSKLNFAITGAGNFDFLKSIEIYLSAPNQAEILVASKYSIPETGLTQLDLDVSGDNLKEYIKESSYSLRVKAVTDKTIAQDINIHASEVFHVVAKLKNLFN